MPSRPTEEWQVNHLAIADLLLARTLSGHKNHL